MGLNSVSGIEESGVESDVTGQGRPKPSKNKSVLGWWLEALCLSRDWRSCKLGIHTVPVKKQCVQDEIIAGEQLATDGIRFI